MKCRIGLLLLLVGVVSAEAKDPPGNIASQAVVRANGRVGAFPDPPPEEDDTVFAVDSGPDLDTGCTFRRGGPLIIELPVRRYVGAVKADGTLDKPGQLTVRGLLSETAYLSLPVFDVDEEGDPTDPSVPPEVDRIYFNGKELKRPLTGSNDRWKMNTFYVDIRLIRFPDEGDGPAINEIRIEIDDLNRDDNQWCTAVDWVALEFQAVAPIFLVHGVLSDGGSWTETDFMAGIKDSKIPYSNAISLPMTGSIEGNGRLLAADLQRLADGFGARKCHIIAHSKGGLDTRAYLSSNYDEKKLQVVSVYTLSTPHRGSPAADAIAAIILLTRNPNLVRVVNALAPALADLGTVKMLAFNLFHSTPNVPFISYGAEADTNGDRIINADEAKKLIHPFLATVFYNVVGHGDRAVVLVDLPVGWGDWKFGSISIPVVTGFVPNDVFVSQSSARFGTYVRTAPNRNHTTMKSSVIAEEILDHIVEHYGAW